MSSLTHGHTKFANGKIKTRTHKETSGVRGSEEVTIHSVKMVPDINKKQKESGRL